MGWDRPKKREKNFSPEFRSYLTRARKFQKNSKKIQKIIKPVPDIIFSRKGMRLAEKVNTKFYSRIRFILDPGKKIQKKIVKKVIKPFPGIIFSQNGMR